MRRFLFLLVLGVGGAYFFRAYCFEGIYVASESMEPSFPKNTHVMVNKFALMYNDPVPGDVIMFDSPVDPSKGLIKRVIAVGGDTIELRDKIVYVNGKRVFEPYVQYVKPDTIFAGDNIPPLKVPEHTFFVMGDNRDVSGDSRDWKTPDGKPIPFLPRELVRGLVRAH